MRGIMQQSAFTKVGVLILSILVLLLGSLFFYLVTNQVEANNLSRTVTSTLTAQSVMEKVDRNFYERFGDVQAFAYNRLAVETASRDTLLPAAQDFINTMTAYYVLYDLMMICNRQGKVIMVNTMDKNGKKINSGHFIGKDMSKEDWFSACMSDGGPKGGAWYSDFMTSGDIGRIYGTTGSGMAYAAPIKDSDGTVVGAWYNYASWTEVTEGIRKEGEENLEKDHAGSFVLLTRKDGSIISADDQRLLNTILKVDITNEVQTKNLSGISLSQFTNGVSRSKGAYTFAGKEWITIAFIPSEQISWGIFFSRQNIVAVLVSLFVLVVVSISIYMFFKKNIINRMSEIRDLQQRLSEGELVVVNDDNRTDEFGEIKKSVRVLAETLRQKASFADEISKGNLNVNLGAISTSDVLGNSLINMQKQLQIASISDKQRSWGSEGLAQISAILRMVASTEELYSKIIKFIVTYLNANQGGLFIVKDVDGENRLNLMACYAFDKKKFVEKSVGIGEGLIGQCVLEKETLYLTQVPENYVSITSGLGSANPRSILIVPLKSNDEVFGVIELASFHPFQKHEIELAEKFAESVGASISAIEKSEETTLLLQQLQQQTEEMKAQEEEMRQNMEELAATQEDMVRKQREYESKPVDY